MAEKIRVAITLDKDVLDKFKAKTYKLGAKKSSVIDRLIDLWIKDENILSYESKK